MKPWTGGMKHPWLIEFWMRDREEWQTIDNIVEDSPRLFTATAYNTTLEEAMHDLLVYKNRRKWLTLRIRNVQTSEIVMGDIL